MEPNLQLDLHSDLLAFSLKIKDETLEEKVTETTSLVRSSLVFQSSHCHKVRQTHTHKHYLFSYSIQLFHYQIGFATFIQGNSKSFTMTDIIFFFNLCKSNTKKIPLKLFTSQLQANECQRNFIIVLISLQLIIPTLL